MITGSEGKVPTDPDFCIMNTFEQRVWETMRQYHMTAPGEHIVIGLSGGADSTALLLVLHALEERLSCTLSAVHVHHGLRESADLDEAFCVELCERLGIPLTVIHADAAAYAAEYGESLEQAGRTIRYNAYYEALEGCGGAGRIATAHHREDLAETVLFNLCRGSGITGAAGIPPVMGELIRPLIDISRTDIEQYLRDQEQTWCEDETNQDTAITRNYLRRVVIPSLAQNVNAGTTDHLVRFAGEAAETEAYLLHETTCALGRCTIAAEGESAISVTALQHEPRILQKRIILCMLAAASGCRQDLGAAHVDAVLRICNSTSGTASVDLPYGMTAVRTYDLFRFRVDSQEDGNGVAAETGFYRMRVFCRAEGDTEILQAEYTKWFDYDRIGAFPVVRKRREGDVITLGNGVNKSLQRFMIDHKVPRELRDRIDIPYIGNQALWIPGYQMNSQYKVSDSTQNILEITYVGGE